MPVATIDQDQNIRYYHTDHLGTPQELTNTKGEIIWEAEYVTWGNTVKVDYKQKQSIIEEDNEVALQPLRFQGQYHDQETGLHYNRFRYYDPDVGRFTTQDPLGILASDNFYAYVPNPILWVDPLGLAKKCGLGSKKKLLNKYTQIKKLSSYGGYTSVTGAVSFKESLLLGKMFVGSNSRMMSNGRGFVSEDGTKTFRFPARKPNSIHSISKIPYSNTGKVANFETRDKDGKLISNVHIDVCD